MKIYKFRPLATCEDYCRIKYILETGKFWCSNFLELNDPMEGAFLIDKKHRNHENIVENLFEGKSKYKICSFSGGHESEQTGFYDPTLWGHYANGFKGVVIEVEKEVFTVDEIDENLAERVVRVDYNKEIMEVTNSTTAKELLTKKLEKWKKEEEYRFFKKSADDDGNFEVGEITGIYFGAPYNDFSNIRDIEKKSRSLLLYNEKKHCLMAVADKMKIPHYMVSLDSNGKIVKNVLKSSTGL